MATKKTVTPEEEAKEALEAADAENAKNAEKAEKVQEAPRSAWDETVEMIVPRKPRGEEQSYYVCVNDRRFLIPANGEMQKLPRSIAEALAGALAADAKADEFADKMPKRYGAVAEIEG